MKIGNKLWITINETETGVWLTRSDGRANHSKPGVLIECPLTPSQQHQLQNLVNQSEYMQ